MNNFLDWWQRLPQNINPVFLELGPISLRYYGLMFVAAILVSYFLLLYRHKTETFPAKKIELENFFTWIVVGVVLGGRLGYVAFYNLDYFLNNPLEIFLPFSFDDPGLSSASHDHGHHGDHGDHGGGGFRFTGISGMSFHGAFIGSVLAAFLFCKKNKFNPLQFLDFIIPTVAAGYTFGRLGNFLNGELFGRVTEKPWGMIFPLSWTADLRHPSQLYEAFFEGIFLFIILWILRKKKMFHGFLFSIYIIGYGLVRFFIEYTREPDSHIGFVAGGLSMGQMLCMAMIVFGLFLYFANFRKKI